MDEFENEVWKPTYHPNYHVSNLGRVKSFHRHPEGRILTLQYQSSGGYPAVIFWTNYRFRRHTVHRLVVEAFLGPIPAGMQVMHLDDDPRNARLDNLRIGSPLDNVQDMHVKGRARKARGDRSGKAKLREAYIPDIRRRLSTGEARWRIGRDYGVTVSAIKRVADGSAWAHV